MSQLGQTRQIDRPTTLVSCPLRADRYRNSAPQRIDVVCQQRSCDLAPAYLALYDPTLHNVLHRWRLCVRRLTLSGACAIALFISLLTSPQYAIAQSLAGQQIRLVVPFPAGGPTDIVARPVAQMLGDAIKAIVVVDNRGGAGGSLGADAVAKAAPDGRTLLMATVGTHAINPTLYKTLPYDAVRDFTPIGLVAMAPVAIVVHPSQPVNTVADLVALAKRTPGKLNYGSAGAGTPGHLTGEIFKAATGINIQHVPYRGSAHLRQMIQQLAYVREEGLEGDHLQAVSALLSTQKRRSLVAWLTDFPETAMTPELIDAASEAASRHLVLFVVIGQPDLAALASSEPDSVTNMYRTTAAQEALHRREVLLAKLRQRGALAVEVSSAAASVTVVNSYLDVKTRNLL